MKRIFRSILASALFLAILNGCATQYPVNFKVHSEPEGAHVIYRQGNEPWIYLGVTPLSSFEMIDEKLLEKKDKISLKTMRYGYMDQIREWNSEQLKNELKSNGNIFWTPHLVKNIE